MNTEILRTLSQDILREILNGRIRSKDDLQKAKIKLSKKYRIPVPKDSDILAHIPREYLGKIRYILGRKLAKVSAGVATVAVMTSPARCPHGKCIYCPGGVDLGTPQSYTGLEPAARRGLEFNYDPYLQVIHRIKQIESIGQPSDKIELIVMGGTFLARDRIYRDWFIKRCYDALNGQISCSLEDAIKANETAKHRCVALTIETRPDWCFEEHVDEMLRYGTTRVEIGVQTVYEDILKKIRRGHSVEDIIRATRVAKDAGLKVVYHLMPKLPGCDLKKDLKMFKTVFTDSRFRPDMLKIYPTLVIKGTELYNMWKRGEYEPPDDDYVIKLLKEVFKIIPPWVRVQRVMRDIPSNAINAGPRKSHIRDIVIEELEREGIRIREMRYREVGFRYIREGITPDLDKVELVRIDYEASNGKEIFLSFEDIEKDILIAYLRLRLPSESAHRSEIAEVPTAIVRELKVDGPPVPLGEKPLFEWQHRGFGRRLMLEAERIAFEEFGVDRVVVTSGVGVREYYRKLGYNLLGPYMGAVRRERRTFH